MLEFILELLLELILEGVWEATKSKKVSPWIRYPLVLLLGGLFLGVTALIIWAGVCAYQRLNRLFGILLIFLGVVFFMACVIKGRKEYLVKREKIRDPLPEPDTEASHKK